MRPGAGPAGGGRPRIAIWLATAVDPGPLGIDQLRQAVVGYLAAPGYAGMFTRAGFGDLVTFARSGPRPGDLFDRVPRAVAALVESSD